LFTLINLNHLIFRLNLLGRYTWNVLTELLIITVFQDLQKEDEGRYYCIAENKFGRETVNGFLLVRSMDCVFIDIKKFVMHKFQHK